MQQQIQQRWDKDAKFKVSESIVDQQISKVPIQAK